jgi:hypothetical protein
MNFKNKLNNKRYEIFVNYHMHDIETINSLGKHEGSGVNSKETHEN